MNLSLFVVPSLGPKGSVVRYGVGSVDPSKRNYEVGFCSKVGALARVCWSYDYLSGCLSTLYYFIITKFGDSKLCQIKYDYLLTLFLTMVFTP